MDHAHAPADAQPSRFSREILALGLESSCDDTAAALIRRAPDGSVEVLGEAIHRQAEEHAPFGGVVPEIAARAHAERLDGLVREAMAAAGAAYADLDVVAATAGPGLVGGVMVGLMTGKAIALAANRPFVAVNHLEGHALSPWLSERIATPYLALLVSGGHTQTIVVRGVGASIRLGSTIDDAAGEAFDKTAKLLGLGHPGGPALERLAADGEPKRFALPRPFAGAAHADFSFAGLKSAAARLLADIDPADSRSRADLAASFQAAVAEVLVERTAKAISDPRAAGVETLAVVGGVAANAAVRAALGRLAHGAGLRLVAPPLKWCTDNAAMIALVGAERFALGRLDALDVAARPRWPLDASAAVTAPAVGGGLKGPKA